MRTKERRQVLSWALYDWANSAFATTVMAGFFPVYFKTVLCAATPPEVSTFRLGLANSGASVLIAFLAPILGAMADIRSKRKSWLLGFTCLGAAATALIALHAPGSWSPALLTYSLAALGFGCAVVFYDSLLPSVAKGLSPHRVSALGYALGYLGGGLLFSVQVFAFLRPGFFHLGDKTAAVRASFVSVGIWWFLFSLPLFLLVPEDEKSLPPSSEKGFVKESLGILFSTLRELASMRPVLLFLAAYWLYIDGVYTVIKMALDYGLSLGFPPESLITALLITQFVGFPSALGFGRLAARLGAMRSLQWGIIVYIGVTAWASSMSNSGEFYILAVLVGLVQGGVQALSRSVFAEMIPAERSAEYFGLFNIVGKFASIVGPLLMGMTAYLSGSNRIGILSICLLFAAGIMLLRLSGQAARRTE